MAEEALPLPPAPGQSRTLGRFFSAVIRTVLVTLALLALWIGGGSLVAWRFAARVRAARPPSAPPLEKLAASFPPTGSQRVRPPTRRAGGGRRHRHRPGEEAGPGGDPTRPRDRPSWRSRRLSASTSRIRSSAPTIVTSPAPDAVRRYLEGCQSAIEAIEEHILRSEISVWEWEPERGLNGPLPNLGGHIQLQRLLVLDAFEKHRGGSSARAFAVLDAAWKLNRSLWIRPEMLCARPRCW